MREMGHLGVGSRRGGRKHQLSPSRRAVVSSRSRRKVVGPSAPLQGQLLNYNFSSNLSKGGTTPGVALVLAPRPPLPSGLRGLIAEGTAALECAVEYITCEPSSQSEH